MEAAIPRNGSGVYGLPAAYLATTGTTITATQHNVPLTDIEADLNAARPIGAGGTGASTASAARDNLGVTIGSDVQAFSTKLTAMAALAATDGNFIVGNGTTWVAESGATVRASLGLTLGTDVVEPTRSVSASGLATGGGDLSEDRTITVTEASQAEAEAGTASDVVMTPRRTKQAIDEFRGIYTGASSSQTDLPIGSIVMVRRDAGAIPTRNATATVRLGTSGYAYTNSGSGSVLTGTWRSRGSPEDNSNANWFLVQRTA